ncbi:MAG: hypothetical protein VX015_05725 [Planctomycetota bacterium]|nr:hypothetical protein [Planctomycetota bacterium]
MPPSVILEVLKITEAEMELRDATREAEQAREARAAEQITAAAGPLAEEQEDLVLRTENVIQDIRELPEGEFEFEGEIQMLRGARAAMDEAFVLLDDELTGSTTIAAETEAIELLLRTRRSGGAGGGGGGSTPGSGGNGGTEATSALALAGRAIGAKDEVEERDVDRSTSRTASKIPAEFVEVLDRYFDALEGR